MNNTFLVLLLLAFVACNQTNEAGSDQQNSESTEQKDEYANEVEEEIEEPREPHFIELKDWELQSYTYKEQEISSINSFEKPNIRFDHTKVGGFAGCNRFFGKLVLEPDTRKVQISDVGRTKKKCSKTMATEARYIELLSAATSFENNLLNLTLNCGEIGQLQFRLKE